MGAARVGCLGVSALAALFMGLVIAEASRPRIWDPRPAPQPITPASALGYLAPERAAALTLGFTQTPEQGDENVSGTVWNHPIALRENECISVLFAASGYLAPEMLALDGVPLQPYEQSYGSRPNQLVSMRLQGQVGHLQWCSETAANVYLWASFHQNGVDAERRPMYTNVGSVHYEVLRAPLATIGGPMHLNRGEINATAMTALQVPRPDVAYASLDRIAPPGVVAIAPPVTLRIDEGATLLPPLVESYQLLYTMSARDAGVPVNPRVNTTLMQMGGLFGAPRGFDLTALTAAAVATGMPPTQHDAIVDLGRNSFYRVLAVVNATGLGPAIPNGCVLVHFARSVRYFRAGVQRFNRLNWNATNVLSADHVSIDRVCTNEGSVAYVVPDRDQQEYSVRMYPTNSTETLTAPNVRQLY